MIQQHAIRPTRTLAILAISASLLLAAVGFSVVRAQVVRDPANPAFAGNTVDTTTTTSVQPVRDPQNPAYAGNTIDTTTTTSVQPLHDPENPYWTGATTTDTSVSGAGSRVSDQTNFRGANQGLR